MCGCSKNRKIAQEIRLQKQVKKEKFAARLKAALNNKTEKEKEKGK